MRISDWSSDVCSSDLPFVKSDNTLGPVLVYVNDEEKPGAIRISADAEPGRPLDPFHAAIAGTYKLCAGSGSGAAPPATPEPSPAAGTPLEWTNLPSLVGRYPGSYSKEDRKSTRLNSSH